MPCLAQIAIARRACDCISPWSRIVRRDRLSLNAYDLAPRALINSLFYWTVMAISGHYSINKNHFGPRKKFAGLKTVSFSFVFPSAVSFALENSCELAFLALSALLPLSSRRSSSSRSRCSPKSWFSPQSPFISSSKVPSFFKRCLVLWPRRSEAEWLILWQKRNGLALHWRASRYVRYSTTR